MKKAIIIFAIIGLSIVALVAAYLFYTTGQRNTEMDEYLKRFDIVFSGVIVDEQAFDGRHAVFTINVTESSTDSYDPSEQEPRYFCTISNNKAKLFASAHLISPGDSVYVNGLQNKASVYRNRALVKEFIPNNSLIDHSARKRLKRMLAI